MQTRLGLLIWCVCMRQTPMFTVSIPLCLYAHMQMHPRKQTLIADQSLLANNSAAKSEEGKRRSHSIVQRRERLKGFCMREGESEVTV